MHLRRALLVLCLLMPLAACDPGEAGDDDMSGGADADIDVNRPDADPTAPDATPGAFLSPCTVNTDCQSMLCFDYNMSGPHCTHACTLDTDCEAPSPGCNGMGVCKLQ